MSTAFFHKLFKNHIICVRFSSNNYNIFFRISILTNPKHYAIISTYTLEKGGVINLSIWWAEQEF